MPPSTQLTSARARQVVLPVDSAHTMDDERAAARDTRRPSRARPVAVPADFVLNFSGYEASRPAQPGSPSSPRASGRGRSHRPRPRPHDHFVTANCRFAVNPDLAPVLSDALVDADAPLDWRAVDIVFVEREATQEAAHSCPICLQDLSCPKITPCGHVFDHVCLLQHVAFSETDGSSAADVKCPLCSNRFAVDSLKNIAFREVCPVQVGSMCEMSLVSTAGKCTIAVPHSAIAVHEIPAQVDSFERMFARFVFASRPFLLDMLAQMSSDLRNALAEDRSLKPYVDQASRDVKATRQAIRRRSSRESRPESMMPVNIPGAAQNPLPKESHYSPSSSLDSEPEKLLRASLKKPSAPKLRLFYQAHDAQNVYLHPVNHRCLLFEHGGDLTDAKTELAGRVLEIERHTMDEVLRRRYRFLKHLPEGCEFVLVELDLSSTLSQETLARFRNELSSREAARIRRKKENEKESLRVSRMQTESLQDYFRSGTPRQQNTISNVPVDRNDETSFPALGGIEYAAETSATSPQPQANTTQRTPTNVSRRGQSGDIASSPGSAWGGAEISSYSSVASNMGLFPALGSGAGAVGASPPSPLRGAWATAPRVSNNGVTTGASQGRESRRHRRSNGRQTFTVLSNAGNPYRR